MKTFIEWCQHYEYDPESPAAKVDYLRYRDQLELFKDLLKEPVGAGDIVGIVGLTHTVTGDTLSETNKPILLESIEFPETVISMAIEPDTAAERKKLDEKNI